MTQPISLFETTVAKSPRALFSAAQALISDLSLKSLAEAGLCGERLAQAVDALSSPASETMDALRALTFAIACSDLPVSDQQPYADAIARFQANQFYDQGIADFTDYYQTDAVLKAPGAPVWLACEAVKFDPSESWAALATNPLAQLAAVANPHILFDQAIQESDFPDFRRHAAQCAQLSPELLTALAVRLDQDSDPVSKEQGLQFSCEAMESLASANALPQARALALHALAVLSREPELDSCASSLGNLLCFAHASDPEMMPILAHAAHSVKLRAGGRERSNNGKSGASNPHHFIFAPNGHGGLHFPYGDQSAFPLISLAQYALAFGSGPSLQPQNCNPKTELYSPELFALAQEIRALGLDKDIERGGSVAALRSLALTQHDIETKGLNPQSVDSDIESFALLSELTNPGLSSRAALRV